MNIEGLVRAEQFQVPNLKDTASKIRGKSSLTQADIGAVADCLIKAENALSTLKSVLAGLDAPTWFPYIRVGYPEEDPPLVADDNGLRLRGDALITGTIEASAFNISQPVVVDLVLTNNSPTAGKVAWSACTVVYQGTEYAITGNNTLDRFIWWQVGNTTFSTGTSYTPATNIFLIATNNTGIGDTAWNKLADYSIQKRNIVVPFLEGFIPKALVEMTVDLASQTGTIFSASTPGVLLSISGYVKTATGTTPTLNISIDDVDGVVGAHTLSVYAAAATFSRFIHMLKSGGSGDGSNVGDFFNIPYNISFLDSMTISASAFPYGGTGEIYIGVLWAEKIN